MGVEQADNFVNSRRRERIAFLVGAALHVAVLVGLRHAPSRRPVQAVPVEQVLPSLDLVELDPVAPIDPAPTTPEARESHIAALAPVAALAAAHKEPSSPDEAAAEAPLEFPPIASPNASANTWSFDPTKRQAPNLATLGVGERTGQLARETGVAVKDAGGAIPVDDRDLALGIFRGGALASAVDEVARSADAPLEGIAVFEVTIGPGAAPHARLVEASTAREGWAALVGQIDRVAQGNAHRVQLPADGRGLRVVVRVEAVKATLDGRKESDLGTRGIVSPGGIQEGQPGQASKLALPGVGVKITGKVCSLRLATPGTEGIPFPISGGCNPEMIGTRTFRRVRTKVVGEERVSL